MFFFFVGGLNQEVRRILQSGAAKCPRCGSDASLVEYDNVLKVFFVPVWRWLGKQPAIYCDNCNLLMPRPSIAHDAKTSHQDLDFDRLPRCWSCSRPLQRDFSYCPFCGSPAQ